MKKEKLFAKYFAAALTGFLAHNGNDLESALNDAQVAANCALERHFAKFPVKNIAPPNKQG